MTVQIQINGGNAAEAVQELAALASHFGGGQAATAATAETNSVPTAPTNAVPVGMQSPYPQTPMTPPTAVPTGAPVQTQPVAQPQQPAYNPVTGAPAAAPVTPPAAVPTAAQTYTLDQIAVAATQLVDAGRQNEVVQMLQQFGGPPLTAVAKEHYGAIATQLRAMGAKI